MITKQNKQHDNILMQSGGRGSREVKRAAASMLHTCRDAEKSYSFFLPPIRRVGFVHGCSVRGSPVQKNMNEKIMGGNTTYDSSSDK